MQIGLQHFVEIDQPVFELSLSNKVHKLTDTHRQTQIVSEINIFTHGKPTSTNQKSKL